MTTQAQLMALNLSDGKVRWVQQLDLWEYPDDKEGVIAWYGPVLAGGQLWLTNSLGQLQSYHPATGAFTANYRIGGDTNRPAIVAGDTLFTLDDAGRLTAWR
jgi:outer membrane protein assembly factor BamB